MASNSVKRTVTEIDPIFYIPDGVDELVHSDVNIDDTGDGAELEADNDNDSTLNPPGTFKIISQDVHRDKSGHRVVDVVAEIETVEGATYEVRVTKA